MYIFSIADCVLHSVEQSTFYICLTVLLKKDGWYALCNDICADAIKVVL